MLSFFPLAILSALAGRALAQDYQFNVTLGAMNLTTTQILALDYNVAPISACSTNCTSAQAQLTACGNDFTCLCRQDTFQALLDCQQCMFTSLIAANKPMPDPRAGSNPLLGLYSTACVNGKTPLNNTVVALAIPENWDGPAGIFVPLGPTVIVVGLGTGLAASAILLLSNM